MKKGLSILKPEVKTKYLHNAFMEKVRYLEVPKYVDRKALESDIKNGAVHMKEVLDLIDKNSSSRHIVVTAPTEEQGLLAISYLAACYNAKMYFDGDGDENEKIGSDDPEMFAFDYGLDEDEWDEEEWQECAERLPLIESGDLIDWMGCEQREMSGIYNDYQVSMRNQNLNNRRRYWQDLRTRPVCILMSPQRGIFGGGSSEEMLAEAVRFFDENERVYILQPDQDNSGGYPGMFGGIREFRNRKEEDEDRPYMTYEEKVRNYLILNFTADCVKVRPQPEKMKKYYKEVLHSHILKRGMDVAKGFSYDRVINLITAMENDKTNELIEKVFLYALKDRKLEAGYLFQNADFAFVDLFVRSATGIRGGKGQKTARERLQSELIGMEEIKRQVYDVVNVMKFNKLREKNGIRGSQYHNVHLMLGAPGTAKTTVAKLMGEIMMEEKLLKDNRFICVNGAELKGMYVGHSAPKTHDIFERHDIIVIDEAYSLVDTAGSADCFSNESIAQLVIELENHADDRLVIFAGYGGRDVSKRDNRMKLFLDANPGIKSRINSTFYFPSYTPDEMVEIFQRIAKNEHYRVQKEAEAELKQYFESRIRDSNFGNGREARSLLEGSVLSLSGRLFGQNGKVRRNIVPADMKRILLSDVRQAIERARMANDAQLGRSSVKLGFLRE